MEQLFKIRIAGHVESLKGDMPAKEFNFRIDALKRHLEDILTDLLLNTELEGVKVVDISVEAKRRYK
jgi:hypothetical protein